MKNTKTTRDLFACAALAALMVFLLTAPGAAEFALSAVGLLAAMRFGYLVRQILKRHS